MKNITIFILCLAFILSFVPPTQAQNEWTVPINQQLDVSLLSLRQKEQDVLERNRWLEEEMKNLELTIKQMQSELQALEESRALLSDNMEGYDEHIQSLSVMEKQALRANMSVDQLESERRRLSAMVQQKESVLSKVQDALQAYSQQIDLIHQSASKKTVELSPLQSEINKYQSMVERSKTSLRKLEQQFQDMTRRHWKPMQKIDELSKVRDDLKLELGLLEDELDILHQEEEMLAHQIQGLQSPHHEELTKLRSTVKDLASQSAVLEETLRQANRKLEKKHVDFKNVNTSSDLLAENLTVIRRENETLQDKIINLRSTLEKLGKY